MVDENWQKVREVFDAALRQEPEDRQNYLNEACGDDKVLLTEVESLFSSLAKSDEFLETPAVAHVADIIESDRKPLASGTRFGHYELIRQIGTGGMGEVYLASDTRLDRKVALKFLPAHFTQDKVHLRRFQQEARVVAALSHPNVCTIHEVFETREGRHCIAMEYVEGVTLRKRIARGRMTIGAALDAAIQIASALAAAHAAGIVHRDIKPENVMVRPDGLIKVLDFGIAKYAAPGRRRDAKESWVKTATGVVVGTTAYMSPEQARGLSVDARTDIWSLGVILYEMVARCLPFPGKTPTDRMAAILEREPQPLGRLRRGVPAELERIVSRALAKDRDERYARVADLAEDLRKRRATLGAEPPFRFALPVAARGLLFSRKRKVVALATLLLVITAALVAGLSYLYFRQNPTPASQIEVQSFAVVPLENVSGDAAQDYFADGMTEVLINDLAKIGALRANSRASEMRYQRTQKPPLEIGRELKADAVLTGSVARNGDRVLVNLQLIHVPSGQNLWTKDYNSELRDVLTLQAQVRHDVAEKIGRPIPPEQPARITSVNTQAYDHYLRGQFHLYRQTKEDNEASIAALEQAVAKDPNFAAAYAELAQAYIWRLFLFAPREKQLEEKAFVAVEKALALDPDSAVAYLARGRLLWTPANHFPHERAIKEYRHALSLNPTLDEARNQLALVYSHIGAFPEVFQESQLALATDPNNLLAQYRIGQTLNFQGKYDEALSVLRAIPQDANPALVGNQIAWALFNLGRKDEAAALLEHLLKGHPEDAGGAFTSMQALLAASAGQERIAEDKIKSAIEKGKGFGHFHHTAYNIACAYALMKKSNQAIKWLEAAADDGFPCYPLFEADPNLDKLRQDARFVALLSKLRQKWEYYKTIV